jgi:hypothetical protein
MQPAREISYVFRYAPDDCSARLEVVVQKTEEMRSNGFESDRATTLIHFLCRSHLFEKACAEFEDIFQRGSVPRSVIYKMLINPQNYEVLWRRGVILFARFCWRFSLYVDHPACME